MKKLTVSVITVLFLYLTFFCFSANADVNMNESRIVDHVRFGDNLEFKWELYDDGTLVVDGTTEIGKYGYLQASWYKENQKNIKRIVIKDGVTSIGERSFSSLKFLTSVELPDGVTNIGDRAFEACTSLKNINIPNGVTNIGKWAFVSCSSLESIELPNSVTTIGEDAFGGCTSLTNIRIPDSVTSIGKEAFSYCSSLTNLEIPGNITNISPYAFHHCSSLEYVKFGDGVTSIGEWAFLDCTLLKNIEFGNSVTLIGEAAFYDCPSLENIRIPESVTSIGEMAFLGCSSIKSFTVDINSQHFSNDEYGVLYDKNKTTLICVPPNAGISSYTIPNGVTKIGNSAFSYCSSLKNVIIPVGVTSIGDEAFLFCNSLESITIPDSVTTIGSQAFCNCSSLTRFDFPDSVTTIESNAFGGCISLKIVIIGSGVTRIPASMFRGCSSLEYVDLPNGLVYVGPESFKGCTSLKSIGIPESVISISNGAFSGCSSLEKIMIPVGVERVDVEAFYGCDKLVIYGYYYGAYRTVSDYAMENDIPMKYLDNHTSHFYDDWVVIREATETKNGQRVKMCVNCGHKVREEIPFVASENRPEICLTIGNAVIVINGEAKALDVPAQIINSRTMVPLRAIFEALGASVEWDDATKTVTSVKGDTIVKLTIGQASINVNGVDKALDVPAQIVESRTLVPVRAVAESFGCEVSWVDAIKTVIIK